MSDEQKHGERISAAETEIRALVGSVTQLTHLVREGHARTSDEIGKLGEQISRIGKANWPTYFAAGALILSIGTAAIGPTWLRIGSMEVALKELREVQYTHALLPIHPIAAERLKWIDWRLNHLEKTKKKGKQ